MNRKWAVLLITVIMISTSIAGCLGEDEDDGIQVAVTILPQKQIVEAIGGDLVEATALVPSGMSVHDFTPTPSLIAKMAGADAYVKVGTGVEFETLYMGTILEQNPDLTVIDCSTGIDMLPLMGSDGTVYDPHIWTTFSNLETMSDNILDGLTDLFPEHAATFIANHEAYLLNLQETAGLTGEVLSDAGGSVFLAYHPSWNYFAHEYGIEMLSVEEGDKEPTAMDLLEVIEEARDAGVTVVVFPPQFDRDTAEYIADQVGGEAVYLDPLVEDIISEIGLLASYLAGGTS